MEALEIRDNYRKKKESNGLVLYLETTPKKLLQQKY